MFYLILYFLSLLEKMCEKGTMEDEMVGWHHRLNGYEFEQALGDDVGQGRLVYYSSWCCKELDTTERLNSNIAIGRYYL